MSYQLHAAALITDPAGVQTEGRPLRFNSVSSFKLAFTDALTLYSARDVDSASVGVAHNPPAMGSKANSIGDAGPGTTETLESTGTRTVRTSTSPAAAGHAGVSLQSQRLVLLGYV